MTQVGSARWLLVSRPVSGPVLDGGPALLRELIPALPRDPVDYFGDVRRPLRRPSLGDGLLRVPRLPGGRGAELIERATIAAALLTRERRRQPLHLFVAPGALTERAAASLVATPPPAGSGNPLARVGVGLRSLAQVARLAVTREAPRRRRAPVLQTLTCAAGLESCVRWLGALDGVVALSDDTRDRLIGAGLARSQVHRIYPGVDVSRAAAIDNPGALSARRAILYAGELDAGASDRLIEVARTLGEPAMRGWQLIIACRPDEVVDRAERARIGRELAGAIGSGRVEFHGEVEDMAALQRRCAMQLYVADAVHRRPDIPLVVLEGLANGLPLVILDRGPLRELFQVAARHGRELGARVDPGLGPAGLVAAVHDLVARPETLLVRSRDACALARESFSAARMGADYAALHREVLAREGLD